MKNGYLAFLLIATSLLVHGVALQNPYYFDDTVTIKENADLDSKSPPFHFYKSPFINRESEFTGYRPTLMMSYWANARLLGKSATTIRFGNILIHTLNAVLWVFLLLQLTKFSAVGSSRKIAWWSGFAFALHPIQTLPINFLWKRSSVLEIFFILLSCLVHARERNRNAPYRWWVVILQMILFMGALTTKESGAMLPFFILLIDLCFYRQVFQKAWRQLTTIYLPLGLLTVGYYYFRIHSGTGWLESNTLMKFQPDFRDLTPVQYFLESLAVLPQYFGLWLLPHPLLFDDPLHFQSSRHLLACAGAGLFLLSCILSFRYRKNPLIAFFFGIIWISFLPVTNIIPIRYVMDQIRMYFPLAGMSGLFIVALLSLQKKIRFRNVVPITSILIIIFYGSLSALQNFTYQKPVLIYNDVVSKYPRSGVGWDNLAVAYHNQEMIVPALQAHRAAALSEPGNPDFMVKDKMWKALFTANPIERKKLLSAIDVSKINATTLLMLVQNEIFIKEYDTALLHLTEAQKRFPAYVPTHLALGQLWEQTGDLKNAQKAYANALLISPNNPEALAGQKRIGAPTRD